MSEPTYQEPAYHVLSEKPAQTAVQPRPAQKRAVILRPAQEGAGQPGPAQSRGDPPTSAVWAQPTVQSDGLQPEPAYQHGEW